MSAMFAPLLRAVSVCALVLLAVGAAGAKNVSGPHPSRSAPPAPEQGRAIQHIVVEGTQRIEPETVLTYISIREGEAYSPQAADTALKTLYATGLFADVKIDFEG